MTKLGNSESVHSTDHEDRQYWVSEVAWDESEIMVVMDRDVAREIVRVLRNVGGPLAKTAVDQLKRELDA